MINFDAPPLSVVIEILLRDMNTGGNILFNGKQLTKKLLPAVKPRAVKSDADRLLRTRTNAEVFSPSHVVKQMVDALDDGQIDSRWLEIACGEAPFITNRYDADSGEAVPFDRRAGVLDRKLRRARDKSSIVRAVQSVYGYELQGDSLLIARANVLLTAAEVAQNFSDSDLAELAEIIAWNFFQLDGTQDNGFFAPTIVDWRDGRKFIFGGNTMKKFDFALGNPPYHEEAENNGRQPPVYNILMKAAHELSKKNVLITPARFLFNQGGTPKDFNQRMLNDPHFKVLDYAPDARKFFKGVDIKGGVAITLRDEEKDFGAIGMFSKYPEINAIQLKVCAETSSFRPLNEIIHTPIVYKLSEKFFAERPELVYKLYNPDDNALRTNIFERLPEVFFDAEPADGREYIQVLGRIYNQRTYKWIRRDYIADTDLIDKIKIFLNESNGTGAFGEALTMPFIVNGGVVCTQTFITVDGFDTAAEAQACLAYIKSKFCRAMLGILKVTQHNPPATWAKVPLQDFKGGDIDWGGDIDAQLYRKYGLDATEIKFIETHVKEMI